MEAIHVTGAKIARVTISPLIFAFIPSAVMADFYALWFDYSHAQWGDFVNEFVFPPLGIVHGLVLLFGN